MPTHSPSTAPRTPGHLAGRRHWLGCCAGLAAGLFTGLDAFARDRATPPGNTDAATAWPTLAEGWRNPCLAPPSTLPAEQQALVDEAFAGLDPVALVDVHAHLLGTGDGGSGCSVHPSMSEWWHPSAVVRRRTLLNASCVPADAGSVDEAYVRRLDTLASAFPPGARWLLFAFEQAHDDAGQPRPDLTTFHVPDAYAREIATRRPDRYGWVASVHPYREDALARVQAAIDGGACAMKWLPSAMNIDLRDRRCRPVYDLLRAAGLPLIVHAGEEKAVPGAGREAYGNPLLTRAAMEAGVRVVIAHCASLGTAEDLDRPSAPTVAAFDLFARLMDEPAHAGLLHGDLSAVFQANRTLRVARHVLQAEAWHDRLLHGSDYPLPGVMPLYAPARWVTAGLLRPSALEPLRAMRMHNPLLFDFVAKRLLASDGCALPARAFTSAAEVLPIDGRAAARRPPLAG